jgi:hypothetical protein
MCFRSKQLRSVQGSNRRRPRSGPNPVVDEMGGTAILSERRAVRGVAPDDVVRRNRPDKCVVVRDSQRTRLPLDQLEKVNQ